MIDVARTSTFEDAVVVLDHVLHVGALDRSVLEDALTTCAGRRGVRQASAALDFADAAAESPGESISRVTVERLGAPAPVLQHRFDTDRGVFRVDFWWARAGIIGEFDGLGKYEDVDAVRREKSREQSLLLRPEVRRVVRWGWTEVRTPGRLQAVLRAAGLPTGA